MAWQTKQSNVICDIMFRISNKRLLIFKPMRIPSTYWHLRASNYFWSQFCFHFSIKQRLFMRLFLAIYKVLRISFVNNPLLAKELCSRLYLLKTKSHLDPSSFHGPENWMGLAIYRDGTGHNWWPFNWHRSRNWFYLDTHDIYSY